MPRAVATQEDSYQGSCAVAGALPPWLKGKLFRAGPGLWEVGERQLRHLTDGEHAQGEARGDNPASVDCWGCDPVEVGRVRALMTYK